MYRQEECEALARVRVIRGRRVEVKHEQRGQRGRVRDATEVEQLGQCFDGGGAQVDVCARVPPSKWVARTDAVG